MGQNHDGKNHSGASPVVVPHQVRFQFLFKIDAKCPSGSLASLRDGSLFKSYPKMMQNARLAALTPSAVVPY